MTFPIVVTFRQMPPSPALRARIRELAGRLERFSPNIVRCRVRIEHPARHKQQGSVHEVRIDIAVPDEHILVNNSHSADPAHEDPYVAARDAFNAARRQLEDYERRRSGKVKRHDGQAQPAPKRRAGLTEDLSTASRVTEDGGPAAKAVVAARAPRR